MTEDKELIVVATSFHRKADPNSKWTRKGFIGQDGIQKCVSITLDQTNALSLKSILDASQLSHGDLVSKLISGITEHIQEQC